MVNITNKQHIKSQLWKNKKKDGQGVAFLRHRLLVLPVLAVLPGIAGCNQAADTDLKLGFIGLGPAGNVPARWIPSDSRC